MMRSIAVVCGAFLFGISAAQKLRTTVRPKANWKATNGHKIEAHGAGVIQSPQDGRWYWYGENQKKHLPNNSSKVNCYSSDNLSGPWRFEGHVLTSNHIEVEGWSSPWIMERPKVIFNTKTKKYVMWFHLDQPSRWPSEEGDQQTFLRTESEIDSDDHMIKYVFKKAAVATADSPVGPFKFIGAFNPDGEQSMDMNLFQDPLDGKAYFIRHCQHEVCISGMTEDYLNTTGVITRLPPVEGLALFRLQNGTYYMLSSHLSGWKPNPMIAYRSKGTELNGAEWEDIGNPTNHATSFDTQPTNVVKYSPKNGEPYFIYMGDDWIRCGAAEPTQADMLKKACYVWLPIRLDGPKQPVEIAYQEEWDLENPWPLANRSQHHKHSRHHLRAVGRHK